MNKADLEKEIGILICDNEFDGGIDSYTLAKDFMDLIRKAVEATRLNKYEYTGTELMGVKVMVSKDHPEGSIGMADEKYMRAWNQAVEEQDKKIRSLFSE